MHRGALLPVTRQRVGGSSRYPLAVRAHVEDLPRGSPARRPLVVTLRVPGPLPGGQVPLKGSVGVRKESTNLNSSFTYKKALKCREYSPASRMLCYPRC